LYIWRPGINTQTQENRIDLHCHSNYSDGSLSVEELLQCALTNQVNALALTDHDTLAGISPLQELAAGMNIKIINGIELTVRWRKYDIHMIGLQFELHHPAITELVVKQTESRKNRAEMIAARLEDCGFEGIFERVKEIAVHDQIGRPHFAKVLYHMGKVRSMQDAFDKYLGIGKKAYVPTPWVSLEAAVEGINRAGGQAVIAHPLKYSLTRTKLNELIDDFVLAGGKGLEVVSGLMEQGAITEMGKICARYGLLASSGSDYHGEQNAKVSLGLQKKLPSGCEPIWQSWKL
jgi:predicted metal-dependent phosphoesterase TrpH